MKIGLVSGSYANRHVAVNPRRVINWYIHKDLIEGEDSKYKKAFLPFPGLSTFCDTEGTNVRRIFVARTLTETRCFAVADQTLYEIDDAGTKTSRGTLSDITNDETPVFMEVNGNQEMMIAHSSASYIFALNTNTLTKITDADFPSGVTSLSFTVGYFIISSGGRVYYSDLNNGLSWNAASVFTPNAYSDPTIAAIVWKDDIYCFGSESIEVYYNDGSSPFSKQPRTSLPVGLLSVQTLCVTEQGLVFVGKTRKGQYNVYFYDGQACQVISPLSVAWQQNGMNAVTNVTWDQLDDYTWDQWWDLWNSSVDISDAEIYYTKNGNVLYYLNIPPLHTTWVFDLTTKEWVERQSLNPNSSTQQEYRGKWMVNFNGLNLVTDRFSGKIYKEDYSVVTENSTTVTRTIISQVVHNEKRNLSIYDLELDTTTGVGLKATPATTANISAYISRDGGNTYSSAITLSTGATTEYYKRPRVFKLGTARDWTFKFVLTDQADIAVQEAIIHGVVDNY